nr:hypothetical protein [Tanacetum cinerariifolium]
MKENHLDQEYHVITNVVSSTPSDRGDELLKKENHPDQENHAILNVISFGLKRSANTILLQCMVSLTGGSQDNDSTLIDTRLKIVLRRADLNEYVIAERDFKYLYPSEFEDLYLLNLQGHLNHLPPKDKKILTTAVNIWTRQLVIRQHVEDFQLGIESYQTQQNLTKPHWDARGYKYKHDYIVIDSSRTAIFRDKYGVQMMMRVNEIHKKDVDRSKAFMFAIQQRLKTRRIFRNLESFVGGRVREGDYRLLKRTE